MLHVPHKLFAIAHGRASGISEQGVRGDVLGHLGMRWLPMLDRQFARLRDPFGSNAYKRKRGQQP